MSEEALNDLSDELSGFNQIRPHGMPGPEKLTETFPRMQLNE